MLHLKMLIFVLFLFLFPSHSITIKQGRLRHGLSSIIPSLINSLNKYLLSLCSGTGIVPGAGDRKVVMTPTPFSENLVVFCFRKSTEPYLASMGWMKTEFCATGKFINSAKNKTSPPPFFSFQGHVFELHQKVGVFAVRQLMWSWWRRERMEQAFPPFLPLSLQTISWPLKHDSWWPMSFL